jgi:protoheme IX farnesyltransferase
MKTLLELMKVKITVAVTFTTAVGYVLARGRFDAGLLLPLLGLFLQAGGAAALNHVQEADIDGRVPRTATRPIPSGRISRPGALAVALGLLALGSALLWWGSGWLPMAIGLATAVLYNGIYTPLKRRTPFAVLPGSLIGALPPLAGWVAGGGWPQDLTIHQVAFFFFIWQVPHFWLLLLFHERAYRENGLPSLFDRFEKRQILRLTFSWTAATAIAGLLMPLFRAVRHDLTGWLIALCATALIVLAARWLGAGFRPAAAQEEAAEEAGGARPPASTTEPTVEEAGGRVFIRCFMAINCYALFVMLALILDRVA